MKVEIAACEYIETLTVVILLMDESQYEIFNTLRERLDCAPLALQPGQSYRCTFELTFNVVPGTFDVCAAVHRYHIQRS